MCFNNSTFTIRRSCVIRRGPIFFNKRVLVQMSRRQFRIFPFWNQRLSAPSRGAAATEELPFTSPAGLQEDAEQLQSRDAAIIEPIYSYPGWQEDFEKFQSGDYGFAAGQRNFLMDGKQARFEINVRALQDLQTLLSYPDWQDDYEEAQVMLFTKAPGYAFQAKIRAMKIRNARWEEELFPFSDDELSDTTDLAIPEPVNHIAESTGGLSTSRITLRRISRVGENLVDLSTTPNTTDDSTGYIQGTSPDFARTDRRSLWTLDASQIDVAAQAQTSTNFGDCVVCLETGRQIAMVPCGHLCLCRVCANRLQRERSISKCPICKERVRSTIKIFIS